MKIAALLLCLVALGASAQTKKPFGPQPVNASTGTYFPLPDAMRSQVRDLQYVNDHIEIENQQILLRLEQNREKQRDLVERMKTVAVGYAIEKHIDTTKFEFDANDVRFVEKKAQ